MKCSVFLLLLILGCGQKQIECSSFETGIFELYHKGKLVNIVERDKEFQIDYKIDRSNSINALSYINWIDNCNFELLDINDSSNPVIIEIKETINDTAFIIGKVTNSDAPILNFKYKYIKKESKLSSKFYKIKDSIVNSITDSADL